MVGEGKVDFERITQVYREESGKKSQVKLVELEPDFYDLASAYIKRLEDEATKASSENPTSQKTHFIQDELRKAKKRLQQIYEFRERKIAILAHSKVSGVEVELKGLTTQEAVLFERLTATLADARVGVFGGSEEPPVRPPEPPPAENPKPEAAEEKQVPKQVAPQRKAVTIYVTEDIPSFAGIDVTYRLRKEDIVSLPQEYGDVLVKRGKARYVDVH